MLLILIIFPSSTSFCACAPMTASVEERRPDTAEPCCRCAQGDVVPDHLRGH